MKNFKRTKLQVRADFRAAAACADTSAPGDATAVSVSVAGAATTSTHAAAHATMNKFKTNIKMKSSVKTKDVFVGLVVRATTGIGGGTNGSGGAPTNPPAARAATVGKQCMNKRKGDHPKKIPSGCISKSRVGAGTAATIAVGVSASTTTLAGAGSTIGSAGVETPRQRGKTRRRLRSR
ncbi:unnamed protein product [Calypogeia fissa]